MEADAAAAAAAAASGPQGMGQPAPHPGDIHDGPGNPAGIPGMRVDPQQTLDQSPFGGADHATAGWQDTNVPPGGQVGAPGAPGAGPLHPTL